MSLEDAEGVPVDDASAASGVRPISDARTLRALAHPVRIALLETLMLNGPQTATEAGEWIGESPTTCSFHLRQLAKYGFVAEAGGGRGRARPWRITTIGMSFGSAHEDPDTEFAAAALTSVVRERNLDRYRAWLETRAAYPRRWREAAGDSELLLYLTADELADLNQELMDLLLPRYANRITDRSARPPGAVPVEMLLFSFPIKTPPDLPEPAAEEEN